MKNSLPLTFKSKTLYNKEKVKEGNKMKNQEEEKTMEERLEAVERAMAISLSGAEAPSQEVLELVNDYIDGKKELSEIQKMVVAKYEEEGKIE